MMGVNGKTLKYQFFGGWEKFQIIYVSILIAIQVAVFALSTSFSTGTSTYENTLSLIMQLSGVLAVVYGMLGRKVSFIFTILQSGIWAYQSLGNISQLGQAIFYIASVPFGLYLWGRDDTATKSLTTKTKTIIFSIAFIFAALFTWLGMIYMHQQFFDAVAGSGAFALAIVAQVLYIKRYTENWTLWVYTNIANITDFIYIAFSVYNGTNTSYTLVGALAQVAMNSALLFNSVYAGKVWTKYSK